MWARVCEIMIGFWLLMSPFIFGHAETAWQLWVTDIGVGFAVISLGLASYWDPMRHAHVGILVLAAWLIGFGRLSGTPPLPPALQNHITVGLLLMLCAIIPNEATQPPRSWQKWYQARGPEES